MKKSIEDILYPEIEPYNTGMLKVSDLHEIYYEESGNSKGKPVLFVHGGPGSGTGPDHRQLFNPQKYRIILFDQRGCGKSKPFGEMKENTTQHLVQDMEILRQHLNIDQWGLYGASWGSTLSLAYAEAYPEKVLTLILRGIFTCREQELTWLYQPEGAAHVFPEAYAEFVNFIPKDERNNFRLAYYKRVMNDDPAVHIPASIAWFKWKHAAMCLEPEEFEMPEKEDEFLAFARCEMHYFQKNGFLEESQLLENVDKITHIPTIIIQGRYDMVCPFKTAWELHKSLPKSELVICPMAGHSSKDRGVKEALIAATDKFSD